MSEWTTDRAIILIDRRFLAEANAAAAKWDPDVGGDKTFGEVRLSADGKEPAGYTACNTALTAEMRTEILAFAASVPWMSVYRRNAGNWTAETALVDAGLQVVERSEVAI
jgi:hypothetical protein